MTLFLDGPSNRPLRRAEEIGSAPPVATTVARQAPEPRHVFGEVAVPRKPAPTAERKRRHTRLAAIRAAALRMAARQEEEIEAATATPAPEEPKSALVEETATAKNWRGPGPRCAARWPQGHPCMGRARKGSDFCRTHQREQQPAAPAKETTMAKHGDSAAMLAAVRAEPTRQWTLDELLAVRGGGRPALYQDLTKQTKAGTITRVGPGQYMAGTAATEKKQRATKAQAPKGRTSAPLPRKRAEASPADLDLRHELERLLWAVDGAVLGFLPLHELAARAKDVRQAVG